MMLNSQLIINFAKLNRITNMRKSIFIVAAAVSLLAVVSCATDNKRKAEVISKENVEREVREFVYPLPTAFEVTEMLNRIEAAYMPAICNSLENHDKYMTEAKRAVNLGIYSADLCYANTYNQNAMVKDYMDVVKKLIDELDMTQAIDPELPSKMENNENNKEELTKLISDTFYDSYEYLNQNNRGPVSLLIVSGSWIEGLYISTHISEFTFENKEVVKILLTQKEPLMKLMELLNQYRTDDGILNVKAALTPLYEVYSKVDESSISEEQINNIRSSVAKIRESLVAF